MTPVAVLRDRLLSLPVTIETRVVSSWSVFEGLGLGLETVRPSGFRWRGREFVAMADCAIVIGLRWFVVF